MKVLFLDDDPIRHDNFKLIVHPSFLVDYVYTAEECIDKLKSNTYDIVSLDHDLGGQVFVDSAERDTGMEVVRFLETNIIPPILLVICHSYNTAAAPIMVNKLQKLSHINNVLRIPFMMNGYKNYFI